MPESPASFGRGWWKAIASGSAPAMASVATKNDTAPTAKGAPRSWRRRPFTAPCTGQHRPGQKREHDPSELRGGQVVRSALLPENDQGCAGQHRECAEERGGRETCHRHAEKPETVKGERGQHLAGDEEPH